MKMSIEEFMAKYEADQKKKIQEQKAKDRDYQDYIAHVFIKNNKRKRRY